MKNATPGTKKKNPAAVALGKIRAETLTFEQRSNGGKAGGASRAESLSPNRRSEIAKKAAAARWAGKKTAPKGNLVFEGEALKKGKATK